MDLQIIIPRAPNTYEIRINSYYDIWKREKEAREPQFIIENTRFKHDPHWRNGYFCMSTVAAINDGKSAPIGPTILWLTVKYTFAAAGVAPYLMQLF